MSQYLVVLVTAGSEVEAQHIADQLVERKLAACANLTPVTSVFRWKGRIQHEGEVLLIIKTRSELFDQLQDAVKTLHSYDVPEIIALPIFAGSTEYLKWLGDETLAS